MHTLTVILLLLGKKKNTTLASSAFPPWKPGAKVDVFIKMLVRSNRFLLNFTIALWAEIRMRTAHFLALL